MGRIVWNMQRDLIWETSGSTAYVYDMKKNSDALDNWRKKKKKKNDTPL